MPDVTRAALILLVLLPLLVACSGERPPRADGPGPGGRWRWERVPIVEEVERPVFERKATATQVIRFVPQYEVVDEEVWLNRRVPLQQEVCDPFTGRTQKATYGHTWTRVPAGTRKVRVFKGYEPEARDSGFCYYENEQTGTETRSTIQGWRWEQVPCDPPAAPCPAEPDTKGRRPEGEAQAGKTEGSGE